MPRSKDLVRTLFVLLLLAGAVAGFFSSLAAMQATPQLQTAFSATDIPENTVTSMPSNAATATPTDTPTATPTNTPTQTNTNTAIPTYQLLSLVINEIGWSGTTSCAGHDGSSDQWVELYNPNSVPINLSGWYLVGNEYYSQNFHITLAGTIAAQGYFLLASNQNVFSNLHIDLPDNTLSLDNNYQDLELWYGTDTLVDYANIRGYSSWPAGSASKYESMERYYHSGGTIPYDTAPTAWVTFATTPYGSPLITDYCGNPIYGTPGRANWASTVTETPSPYPTATKKPTPTFAPTPVPAIVLNEILPRPGSDWNGDGTVNNSDEFIEVENLGPGLATLTNWKLTVMPNNGTGTFVLPTLKLNVNQRAVFFGSTTHLLLEDSGDTVSLVDSHAVIEDSYTYPAALRPDDSWCRIRDGIGNWQDGCFPTPGFENALSGSLPSPPSPQPGGAAACLLPDVAPSAFRLAECNGFGADIWNQQYWDGLAGENEYPVPDPKSKAETYIQ
ncbi:MAG TPA: lamin tail domain-containing protein [Anaerolineales bacterium]|nr:lamin tail domain-containing protein [Anaerolineales bacterium]